MSRFSAVLVLVVACIANPIAAQSFDAAVADAKREMLVDPSRAKAFAAEAANIAAASPPALRATRLATAEWLQGEALIRENNVPAASRLIDTALARARSQSKPTKLVGDLLISRAAVHEVNVKIAEALADYQKAYEIFRSIGDQRSQSLALVSMASFYKESGDFTTALRYYRQSLELYRGDPNLSVITLNNQGDILKELGRFTAARTKFDEALSIANKMNSPFLQARILTNIVRLKIATRDFRSAELTINQALGRLRASEATGWRHQLLAFAAEAKFRQGNITAAVPLIVAAFDGVSLDRSDATYREAHATAYEIYRALGDAPRALAHLQALKRLDDQIAKLTASTNTALMAARFDSANQEARISKLKAEESARRLELAEAETRFQQILFASIGGAAAVVLAVLGFALWQSRRARVKLSTSNAALGRALAAKTEFLATTSHEIRTPLNGILGMTQVMLADARLEPRVRERVGIVHDAGLTMRGLVDDILDVAKMEAGNLTVDALPYDLRTMLEDVTRMWAEQARAKGLAFTLKLGDCPRWLLGDAGRMRQVVYNLLSNAVKFTAAGGVTLRARCGGDRMQIAITDTGIGIVPHKQAEIFESFKQADGGTTRQYGGTGLGLAIVRNIVLAMGGEVRVESDPGSGATFVVDLPLHPAEAPAASTPTAAQTDGCADSLLIVDANPIARAMLKAVLGPRFGAIAFAADMGEAEQALAAGGIEQVLVDQTAIERDERELDSAIAALTRVAPAPIAVLWTRPDAARQAQLIDAGAARVIAKPIAGPALAAALCDETPTHGVVPQAA